MRIAISLVACVLIGAVAFGAGYVVGVMNLTWDHERYEREMYGPTYLIETHLFRSLLESLEKGDLEMVRRGLTRTVALREERLQSLGLLSELGDPTAPGPQMAAREPEQRHCVARLPWGDTLRHIAGDAGVNVVFSGGTVEGWRVYNVPEESALGVAGVPSGALLTNICGVPASEFTSGEEACCRLVSDDGLVLGFRVGDGGLQQVTLQVAPN